MSPRLYRELHNSWPMHNGATLAAGEQTEWVFPSFGIEETILVPILLPGPFIFSSLFSLARTQILFLFRYVSSPLFLRTQTDDSIKLLFYAVSKGGETWNIYENFRRPNFISKLIKILPHLTWIIFCNLELLHNTFFLPFRESGLQCNFFIEKCLHYVSILKMLRYSRSQASFEFFQNNL